MAASTAKIIRIGNSRGIRIPKAILDQLGLKGSVTVEVREDGLMIRPAKGCRSGWEERFRAMAGAGDDRLVDGDASGRTAWDEADWSW